MAAICITGCAGFIGSHLSERVLGAGADVVGIDNLDAYYDPAVKRANLAGFLSHPRFRFIEGDIRDAARLEETFGRVRPDTVVHLAARAGVRPSMEKPLLYEQVNVGGTVTLLEASRKHGVKRFVFGSSSSVYGSSDRIPFSEENTPPEPISPYGATKLAGEALCGAYHRLYGFDAVCLRFFTVYGPRQRPEMAIHKFTRLMWEGKAVPRFGDGSTARDYTFVDDIVDGIVAALERPAGFEVLNLGNSHPVPLADLIDRIAALVGRPARLETLPEQAGDARRTHSDISKSERMLGYKPKVSLDDGLARFVDWFRSGRTG